MIEKRKTTIFIIEQIEIFSILLINKEEHVIMNFQHYFGFEATRLC